MSDLQLQAPKARNPLTHRAHRHQVLWQITIPVLVGSVILVALAVLAVLANASQTSQLADISLVSIIIPALIFGLISLLLLIGSIYMVFRLIGIIPFYSYQLQNFLVLLDFRMKRISNKLVEPFLRVHSTRAKMRAFRKSVSWVVKQK